MNLETYERFRQASKFLEFGLLGFSAFYTAKFGKDIQVSVLVTIYFILFILNLIDLVYSKLRTHNLDLLIKHFYEQNNFPLDADVRITIHKKINKEQYGQYVDYYRKGAKRGKKNLIKKGLVRHAFTKSRGHFTENFTDNNEKKSKLVELYHFTTEEAENQLRDGEMSYYCCPINADGLWGVLYMNAKKPYTFPKQEEVEESQISRSVRALVKMIEHEIS
jgi:ribosomal protein L14E/L6E/L27E